MLLSTKARINIQLTVNKNMENIFFEIKIKIIFSLYRSIETPTPFACFKIISNQHRFSINTIIKNNKCQCYLSLIVDIYLLDPHFLRTNTCWSTQNTHLKRKTSSPEVYILQEHTQTQRQSMNFR